MGFQEFARIGISPPANPGASGTATLLDTTVVLNGMGLPASGITRVQLAFPGLDQASASNGLKAYVSSDKGATWNLCGLAFGDSHGTALTLPATVPADSGTTSAYYDIWVGAHKDVKLTYTTATAPTVWTPVISLQAGSSHSGTGA